MTALSPAALRALVPQAALRAPVTFVAMLLAAVTLSGCGVNNIPTYEEQAKASWAEVQNQYKRRADLIPNLVETTKGYAAQESKVLKDVIEARAKATQSQVNLPPDILTNPDAMKKFEAAEAGLSGALIQMRSITEAYPDLKSNANFLQLQSQIEGTENRIGIARHDYILAVQQYNTEIVTIPGRWWKSLMYPTAKAMAEFTATDAEQQVPQVKFN
jgi:LemA protein